MAKTKEITLIYKITPKEIISPDPIEVERKEKWLENIKKTIPSEWEYQLIKVTYSYHDPEVNDMFKFFNGVIVLYYAIQNEDMITGTPSRETLARYRELILDTMLGYDVRLARVIQRKRASMTEFREVQQLYTFINMVKEELFDPNGYEFPDSKHFWELTDQYGYEQAKKISIETLQKSLSRKLQ